MILKSKSKYLWEILPKIYSPLTLAFHSWLLWVKISPSQPNRMFDKSCFWKHDIFGNMMITESGYDDNILVIMVTPCYGNSAPVLTSICSSVQPILLCQGGFIGRNTFATRRANTLFGHTMHLKPDKCISNQYKYNANTVHLHWTLVR